MEEKILEMSLIKEKTNWRKKGKNSKLPISMSKDPLREKYRACPRDGKCTSLVEIDQS